VTASLFFDQAPRRLRSQGRSRRRIHLVGAFNATGIALIAEGAATLDGRRGVRLKPFGWRG
jgi:hypothetical protein